MVSPLIPFPPFNGEPSFGRICYYFLVLVDYIRHYQGAEPSPKLLVLCRNELP